MATLDVVTGVALAEAPQTLDVVTGVSLSTTASSTQDVVTGVTLISGPLEPFSTVTLPGGQWTQTAGPATAVPTVLMPGTPSPGTSVTYTQPNGTTFSFKVLPHTIFGRDSAGKLFPIRKRPYLGAGTVDPGPVVTSSMPVGDITANGHYWQQLFAEDFNTDVAKGGFTPKTSSPGAGSLITGAAAAPYGTNLTVYPSGYGASSNGKSRPEKVLSVANSCLRYDFSVDAITGEAMAATVHFNLAGAYYASGAVGCRFEIAFQVVNPAGLLNWGAVIQLISSDTDWSLNHGELDAVEGDLSKNMETNWHPYQSTNSTVRWGTQPFGSGKHKLIIEWIPVGNPTEPGGRETVWIDEVKIGETVGDRIARDPRAFLIQTGVNAAPPAPDGITYADAGDPRGSLLVDYVVAYQPTT